MSWLRRIANNYDTMFPLAGSVVDGLSVRKDVPNTSSISSSLEDYEILRGIREIPISSFEMHTYQPSYSRSENQRVRALAAEIQQSREINPLIVVIDNEGPYVLEGGHRYDALLMLGAKSLPALVVIDKSMELSSELDQENITG